MTNFNLFLLLAVLKEKIENKIIQDYENISSVKFTPTIMPSKAEFFELLTGTTTQAQSYLKFAVGCSKLDIRTNSGQKIVYYFYNRNKKDTENSFTEISSLEFGYVDDIQKKYIQLYKKHFADFDLWAADNTKENRKSFITVLVNDCLSALSGQLQKQSSLQARTMPETQVNL